MPPYLEIRHLRMLVIISQHKTLTAAANSLHLTPSALTHRIKEAEHRLSAKLIDRNKKGLQITPAGKRLLEAAKSILSELEFAEHSAKMACLGKEHIVRIATWANTCSRWLPAFLSEFDNKAGGVGFEFAPEAGLRPTEALRDGEIDIAIISGPPSFGEFESAYLYQDELVVVLNKNHPKAASRSISEQEIPEETYFTYSTQRTRGHEYDLVFRKNRIEPKRFIQVSSLAAVLDFISVGMGLSILAKSSLPTADILESKGIKYLPLTSEGVYIDWHVLYRKGDNEPEATHRLVHEMTSWLANHPMD